MNDLIYDRECWLIRREYVDWHSLCMVSNLSKISVKQKRKKNYNFSDASSALHKHLAENPKSQAFELDYLSHKL